MLERGEWCFWGGVDIPMHVMGTAAEFETYTTKLIHRMETVFCNVSMLSN